MRFVIVDKNLPEISKGKLRNLGFNIIETKPLEKINFSLATHPDIQICKVKENFLVTEPTVFQYYKNLLCDYDIIIKSGEKCVEEIYPKDAIYNLASNGEIGIHNFKITDKKIVEEIDFEKIDVKQGYGKCNVLFTKTGIITSDMGIYRSIKNRRKLLIEAGDIDLEGFSHGFIGGASGFLDKVYFIGDVKLHKDFEKIRKFLEDEETEYEILGDFKLKDFGSLIFIETQEEI